MTTRSSASRLFDSLRSPVPRGPGAEAARRAARAALVAAVALASLATVLAPVPAIAQAAGKAQSLLTIPLTIGGRKIVAEVARVTRDETKSLDRRHFLVNAMQQVGE